MASEIPPPEQRVLVFGNFSQQALHGMSPMRQCFYIPDGQRDEHGYIPSLVTEDQPGHWRLPWHWGRDLDEAQGRCNAENTKLGLSEHDVAEIVASSMSRRIGRSR